MTPGPGAMPGTWGALAECAVTVIVISVCDGSVSQTFPPAARSETHTHIHPHPRQMQACHVHVTSFVNAGFHGSGDKANNVNNDGDSDFNL